MRARVFKPRNQGKPKGLSHRIKSGKYRGLPLGQVIQRDPKHVRFLVDDIGLELDIPAYLKLANREAQLRL